MMYVAGNEYICIAMKESGHIITCDTLASVAQYAGYLCHAYCHQGSCTLDFNGGSYTMAAGDCLVVRRSDLITTVNQSEDFVVDVVYVTPEFIAISTPQSNYGTTGQMALFNNPIMHLTPDQQRVCALDFDYIKRRLAISSHNFHRDAMINAIQCMIIDLFDFHVELHGGEKISAQYSQLMEGFIALLERGDYRKEREVAYYADKLCVTAKYLSEVSKRVSGFPANYWIIRYTSLDLSRLLRDKTLSLTEIADMFGFSSTSYLSRYVQKYLGTTPGTFRE